MEKQVEKEQNKVLSSILATKVWHFSFQSLEGHSDATRNKCIASSNKCITSSNKKLLGAKGIATRSDGTLLAAPGLTTRSNVRY